MRAWFAARSQHDFQSFDEGFPEAVRGTAKLCEHVCGLLGRELPDRRRLLSSG